MLPCSQVCASCTDSTNELSGHITCSAVISQAGDSSVTLLNTPVVTLRMGHRCKRRNGSGESQQSLLATISVDIGSAGGQPVWPDCFRLVTCIIFILTDMGLEVQMRIFQGVGVIGNLFLLK